MMIHRVLNTSDTVTSPHNLNATRKDELSHKNLTVARNPSGRKSKSNITMAPVTTGWRLNGLEGIW